jgi:Tol biopolymer transport system component
MIAFTSDRTGPTEIYVMKADGTDRRQLTHNATFGKSQTPVWSPDGTRIAFASSGDAENAPTQLHVMRADGTGDHLLANEPGHNPAWAPDGQTITFRSTTSASFEIIEIAVDGTHRKQLTHGAAIQNGMSWSPDGKHIAFGRKIGDRTHIAVVNSDGTGLIELTNGRQYEDDPAWSPDGKHIAFTRGGQSIWVMNADGTGQRMVTSSGNPKGVPDWSPDGKRILFANGDGSSPRVVIDIRVINLDGSGEQPLTSDPSLNWAPNWQSLPEAPLAGATPRPAMPSQAADGPGAVVDHAHRPTTPPPVTGATITALPSRGPNGILNAEARARTMAPGDPRSRVGWMWALVGAAGVVVLTGALLYERQRRGRRESA